MTGNEGRTPAPLGRPWSVDTLADLHAGVLDEATTARLSAEVRGDTEAQAVLAALEATTADLAALGRVPAPRVPDSVAAKLDAALAREWAATHRPVTSQAGPQFAQGQQLAPVVNLAERRKRRNRIAGWGAGVVAAAAAVTAVVTAVLPTTIGGNPTTGNLADPPTHQQRAGSPPLALGDNSSLNAAVANRTLGHHDYGALTEPGKRAGCLSAHGASGAQPIAARPVTLNGRDGVLFVLTTGKAGEFRLLAVEPSCGPGNPATLADKNVG